MEIKKGGRSMKRLLIGIIAVCTVFGLTACGKKEEKEPETTKTETTETRVENNEEENKELPRDDSFGGRAQFTGFCEVLGMMKDDMMMKMIDSKAQVAMKGMDAKTDAQLYNFVARGGNIEEFSGSPENEAKWLTKEEAEKTITKIEGLEYNTVKVNTTATPEEEAPCYVTGKGNVFCWTPYIFDGKGYVNNITVVKDANGNDIGTNSPTPYIISFTNGETVEITPNEDGTYNMEIK